MTFKHVKERCRSGGLRGYVGGSITPADIKRTFGDPIDQSNSDGKVRWMWCFKHGHDMFTVYDYKANVGENQTYDWHIGAERHLDINAFREWFLQEVRDAN